jgi:hypothetical protein
MKKYNHFLAACLVILFAMSNSFAQDKIAKIALTFEKVDSLNVCKAFVTSAGQPVIEVPVKLAVKRLFADLPIGDAIPTDSTGVATFEFPNDIPSADGSLTIVASIVEDDNYIDTQTSGKVNWGMIVVSDNSNIGERSFSAARDRAPLYFIAISLLIIGLIWGTLIYAVWQVFKIKHLGKIEQIKE